MSDSEQSYSQGQHLALRRLKRSAWAYGAFSLIYLVTFVCKFWQYGISSNPQDWVGTAGMLAALVTPPLAIWSIALVLMSIAKQQEQLSAQQEESRQALQRENYSLDPRILGVEWVEKSYFFPADDDSRSFIIRFDGSVTWACSTYPNGPRVVASNTPDGQVEVLLWKKNPSSQRYRGFLQYFRRNGVPGWYRIDVVRSPEEHGGDCGYVVGRAARPSEAEDEDLRFDELGE